MTQPEVFFRVHVVGTVTGAPSFQQSEDGQVCRFVISGEAGPASCPARLSAFVTGAEAKRCARLRLGDVVEVVGDLAEARRKVKGVEFGEAGVKVTERVKLRFRAEAGEVAS